MRLVTTETVPDHQELSGSLPVAFVMHGIGYFACLREPRIFDLWITKVSKCPRVPQLEALGLQLLRRLRRGRIGPEEGRTE